MKKPIAGDNSGGIGDDDQMKNTSASTSHDSRFNQTLKNVQGLLKGRSFPGKVLLARSSEPLDCQPLKAPSLNLTPHLLGNEPGRSKLVNKTSEETGPSTTKQHTNMVSSTLKSCPLTSENVHMEAHKPIAARSVDCTRVTKFTKGLSESTIILDTLRELAWSGVPPYMRPDVWRLLSGYASPNSDRRPGLLRRKRLEYLECVAQAYDIPDSQRADDEISMLRQIAVDCPRTLPNVPFFQQAGVQKSLERVLYTWAIRHPACGYVQGINDLATPFLVVFLSEYLEGNVENWNISDLSSERISDMEADCYWCLTKLLDGMHDHYTFAQPGIQRLVFKLKELVRRIDEIVSNHMENQGIEFLQFAFRWFNCLLIREIPFHLVTRLFDTYLSEGDKLPEFLVYLSASFLLTWSEELQKLEFQEMVMFLQNLPTQKWTYVELEMVLSRAYIWHTMFNNSPSHLAS